MNITSDDVLGVVKRNLLVVILFSCGFISLIIGLFELSGSKQSEVEFVSGEVVQAEKGTDNAKIVVDVSGAVINPGVYSLSENDRVQDALAVAGGLSAEADRDYVSQSMNLAQKMTDGQKLYIPEKRDNSSLSFTSSVQTQTGMINVNQASESELDSLPGVGPATVEKIISNRPYTTIEDLLEKKSVTKSQFEKIKDKISVY